MKTLSTNIATTVMATTVLSVAALINAANPAQAITFKFNWEGDAGYSAAGTFSYDETTAPTIITESGSGATDYLQSLSVSFYDPSDTFLGTYNTVAGGVSESSFFKFNFDTATKTLFGDFDIAGGTGVIGEYFFQGKIGESLRLYKDVDQVSTSILLDQNSGSISVSPVPEPFTLLGVGTALGFGASFKKKLAKSTKKEHETA
ncbi:PEP-CTERM sorting domain-containing protein [Gloeothece verrucosa]|uniref:PEP-CTERM protein-sorting domain-containing protein n=1 Tax=Gloeothece verrucosa (strain PCC 7822) TaxID=497965 RepID=E0U9B3_GLOV7|nr:PEP-CTERM sorting domain-containing protein [Gloeothece verrucosa]ADN17371.1 conserved hypothetical protein [Gloeothece verrucosa PCC 7822]